MVSMKETLEMINTQDVSGLSTFWNQCICWTRGRLGLAIRSLLGPDKLPVLSPKSRLAVLYMTQAHQEDQVGIRFPSHPPRRGLCGDSLLLDASFVMDWLNQG